MSISLTSWFGQMDFILGTSAFFPFVGGLVFGAAMLALFGAPRLLRLERERAELSAKLQAGTDAVKAMEAQFQMAATRALATTQDQFLKLAQEKLAGAQKDAGFDLEKRQKAIAEMVDPIGKTLKQVEEKLQTLGQSGAVLDAQLKSFAEDQKNLRGQTAALVQVLKNSSARGRWGEMQLSRTLELVGMVENIHFRQQVSVQSEGNAQRPDFIVSLPGNLSIVIDVKTPLDPYWDLQESATDMGVINPEQVQAFGTRLRDHVKKLSAKSYWQQFDSPQFVVMFLPTEGLFSLAVSSDKTLIEDAAMNNVILASPTTILGLLRVIMHAWQQQALAENARTIGQMAIDLNNRMGTFLDHLQRLGRNLGTAVTAYNAAVGTVETRVLPQLKKIEEHQGVTTSALPPELVRLEHTPRDVIVVGDKAA